MRNSITFIRNVKGKYPEMIDILYFYFGWPGNYSTPTFFFYQLCWVSDYLFLTLIIL